VDGTPITDVLQKHPEWELTCLFSPEHGFYGTAAAGEMVDHSTHPGTGLPIHSLYGETRIPRKEWLDNVDLVVTDLKDLGVRCYTYASTLLEMMRLCSDTGTPMLVLDRSTPLEGVVDGPDLDEGCASFVGSVPLPLVYGKTQGELALFLQKTLPELTSLQLEVIRESGQDAPRWIPPSPAIVSPAAALCYPLTVWCEAVPKVWVDRGGDQSFQVWAMPDFPPMSTEIFTPYGYRAFLETFSTPEGLWDGLRFQRIPDTNAKPVCAAHRLLKEICIHLGAERLFGTEAGARPRFFDQLAGTAEWRRCLTTAQDPDFLSHT
jgi:hypothetical protein